MGHQLSVGGLSCVLRLFLVLSQQLRYFVPIASFTAVFGTIEYVADPSQPFPTYHKLPEP